MNPISLCLIDKNDPAIVQCIASIRPFVKEIVVVDGGSSPEHQNLVRGLVDIYEVYTEGNNPQTNMIEDFSKQRNHSFSLATQPWILWADTDDIIVGGENLASIISQYQEPVAIMFPYEYGYNDHGKCVLNLMRERLFHHKEYFAWKSPVHECIVPIKDCSRVERQDMVWKHQRQYLNKPQEKGRNLRILKKYVEEVGDSDPRQLFYLGKEYEENNQPTEAINVLTRYTEIANWKDEHVMACLLLAHLTKDLKWAFRAISLEPKWSEGYFAAGKIFSENKEWKACVDFINIGLSLPKSETVLFINPDERGCDIHKYLNFALNSLNRVPEALDSCNVGLAYRHDDVLFANKKCYQNHLMPEHLNIVFAIGDGLQTWNSETVQRTGIGGSELMAIHMSEGLAKLGHYVTIYNSCGSEAIIHGVTYKPTKELWSHKDCDVLVVSRYANLLDSIQARKKFLWCHDVVAQYATPELLKLTDKVLALSQWHKQNLVWEHGLSEEHVLVTRNGIDLSRFDQTIKKDGFRCINSSSPERSWRLLLELWPKIKKQVPQASLHLYYGFEDLLKSDDNIPLFNELSTKIEASRSLNVVYHGRVNQAELAKEFMKSNVWTYPGLFLETYCIGAAEAMASNCHMVCSDLAALHEVASMGTLIPFGHPEYNEMFVEATVKALLNENQPSYDVKDFDLTSLIEAWNKMLYSA